MVSGILTVAAQIVLTEGLAALRRQYLTSTASSQMGFRSDWYFGRKFSLPPLEPVLLPLLGDRNILVAGGAPLCDGSRYSKTIAVDRSVD